MTVRVSKVTRPYKMTGVTVSPKVKMSDSRQSARKILPRPVKDALFLKNEKNKGEEIKR